MQREKSFYSRGSLSDRGKRFALGAIHLYVSLPKATVAHCLGKQLLRSATSVGAHLSESKRSRSRAEVISKSEVALQELEESAYWMSLMQEAGIASSTHLTPLQQEAYELTAMLVTGIKRLKGCTAASKQPSPPH